ncbi:cycloartenol synthase-like [Gossypium arboreum]|uniref:cycloartenol synthase-like n=1 Tax=Gossypium arboreum TaxID=29729 RepID=UPI0022F156E1|nr:cycloartenol synthase-like [Gossypium arboreum]
MFGTAMIYITLRLLDKEAEEEAVERGREWILRHGTATAISSWGKMYLKQMNGVNNPMPPELLLCPDLLPCHPVLRARRSDWVGDTSHYQPQHFGISRNFILEINGMYKLIK